MKRCAQPVILILLVLTTLFLLAGCTASGQKNTKDCDFYTFDIDNNKFVGAENHQEMGDYQICFYGEIDSFSGLTIGKGADDDVWKEWLQITEDKIIVYDAQQQIVVAEYPHTMEFRDYISVNILADLAGKAKIEILTNGYRFSKNDVSWIGRNGRLYAEAAGGNTSIDNCSLSYFCNGWDKDIWMYGDSYFSTTNKERWTTYLIENKASSIMLSGHDGEGSRESLESLKTQLQYGKPKRVIWCVGMNDGDQEDSINSEYKKCLNEVMQICKTNDIELILTTIPTCPYWFNDYKNEYVKSLNYRYIDFADAVGSYESDTWNDNMLEKGEKRIHPTEEGALAMYAKAVTTVPELLE